MVIKAWSGVVVWGHCLGHRGSWEMGGIYLGNILFGPKINVFLFVPRLGPIRSVKTLRTWLSNTLSSIQVYACSVLPQLLDTTMDVPQWEGTVLLEPRIRYPVSTQTSRTTYAPWHTFDERMKWSWWGTHLPAVLMVFCKLVIIPLSDAMCRQSLWPHRETTQELFCARWSHSSHSMMYISCHHPLLFPKFSIFRQGQARCKFGYTSYAHFYDNRRPMSLQLCQRNLPLCMLLK